MSLQELEEKIRHLDEAQLERFESWFDTYRETFDAPGEADDAELSKAQRAEIERRLDAFDADPSIAVPWEGTIARVKKRLEKLHAAKTADR